MPSGLITTYDRHGRRVVLCKPATLEYILLLKLLSERGRMISLDELLETLYPGETRRPINPLVVLRKVVMRLRNKLAGTNINIITEYSYGYRAEIGHPDMEKTDAPQG